MLIFGGGRLRSLKNCQMRTQNSFSRFSQKILLFSKKLLNNSTSNFWYKKVIFIYRVRRPLSVAQWPSGHVANRVQVERWLRPFNPYFYVQKYGSFDALPAPEIFFIFSNFCKVVSLAKQIFLKSLKNDSWTFISPVQRTNYEFLEKFRAGVTTSIYRPNNFSYEFSKMSMVNGGWVAFDIRARIFSILSSLRRIRFVVWKTKKEKNLWRRKCVRRAMFRTVEVRLKVGVSPSILTLFAIPPLGHYATCMGARYPKNSAVCVRTRMVNMNMFSTTVKEEISEGAPLGGR